MPTRDGAYYLRLYRDGKVSWDEILWLLDRDEPGRERWNAEKAKHRRTALLARPDDALPLFALFD